MNVLHSCPAPVAYRLACRPGGLCSLVADPLPYLARVGQTLGGRLGRAKDAAEFYHYAFELLGYPNRLTAPEEQDLLSTLDQAELAYKKGDDWEAVRLYEIAMAQKEKLYDYKTVAVIRGDTLANIAFDYDCTIESLRAVNQFGEGLVISKNQEILVPVISTDK